MIKCNYKVENQNIIHIHISGHANYSEYGSDIVCSAVSMICYTIGNALMNLSDDFALSIEDNVFVFNDNLNTSESKLLLKTLFEGMLMVENQYNDFIKIEEV